MTKRYFLRNFYMFMLPILIPIIVLGSLSIIISQNYIKEDIDENNSNILLQAQQTMEMIYKQLNLLALTFDSKLNESSEYKNMMLRDLQTPGDLAAIQSAQSFLMAMVNSYPHIQSIYVFFENASLGESGYVLASNGIIAIDNLLDNQWYESFRSSPSHIRLWAEARDTKKYTYHNDDEKIITLYRKIESGAGVIVLNLREHYMQDILASLVTYPEQTLLVFNGDHRLLISNAGDTDADFRYTQVLADNLKKSHVVIDMTSSVNNWKYVSITPNSSIYKIPQMIGVLTVVLVIFSGLVGIVLSYFLTKENYMLITGVISIAEAAEKNQELPAIDHFAHSQYGYIVQNVVKTYAEQNKLKSQLAERKYRIQTMEFQTLQAQINPHFLNNTLNSIFWAAFKITSAPNAATDMIERLSDILDYTFRKDGQTVTVSDEIKHTKTYLDIQSVRYKDSFRVIWKIDRLAMNCEIKRLLLQPLVENSIYHGIKERTGQGVIKIRLVIKNNMLHITVIDNGIGMSKDTLNDVRTKLQMEMVSGGHIGLHNTYRRLKILYNDDCSFVIRSKQFVGTAVDIRFPANIYTVEENV